jgi:hypothetical protein
MLGNALRDNTKQTMRELARMVWANKPNEQLIPNAHAPEPEKDISLTELDKEFRIGYEVFTISGNRMLPFQDFSGHGLMVAWKDVKWEVSAGLITLHLPNISIIPNFLLRDISVSFPQEVGSGISLKVDPKEFARGAAIASNSFIRTNTLPIPEVPALGSKPIFFGKITYLTGATVHWGLEDSYIPGSLKIMRDLAWIDGGTLTTSDREAFVNTQLIRGNRFVGGPRGGYMFPHAATVVGNEFVESVFDASRLPDGVLVYSNRFISTTGVYTFGPQPEVDIVIRLLHTLRDGDVIVFGAKTDNVK